MRRYYNTKYFTINDELSVRCETQDTSYGFRHVAELLKNGWETTGYAKCTYYNRTWERYTYESVLEKLLSNSKKILSEAEQAAFKKTIENGGESEARELKSIAAFAQLGAILAPDQKSKNDFQARILKAGLGNKGLIIPEDWDTLSEDEKEKRLTGAIAALA